MAAARSWERRHKMLREVVSWSAWTGRRRVGANGVQGIRARGGHCARRQQHSRELPYLHSQATKQLVGKVMASLLLILSAVDGEATTPAEHCGRVCAGEGGYRRSGSGARL